MCRIENECAELNIILKIVLSYYIHSTKTHLYPLDIEFKYKPLHSSSKKRRRKATARTIGLLPKIQQTKIFVTCQRFGDLFSFGLVWQYSTNQNQHDKGRFKDKRSPHFVIFGSKG